MYANTRPALGARTLPGRYYTDPRYFATELERVHLDMWLHAGREEQIPEPGDYFLVEIAGESVLVLRDGEGSLGAFYNVCRHRGTRMLTEARGRLPGKIQCPYHAWTYGYSGELTHAPQMEKTEGFACEDYPLRPVAVDSWDGHVFVNFSARPDPLDEHLGELRQKFRPWGMGELRLAHRKVDPLRANWKLIVQNYSECLHCPLLHPQLQRLSHFLSGENDEPTATYLGGRMDLRDGIETLTPDGKSPWRPLPGLTRHERRGVYYWAVLPNLLLNLHPDYMLLFQLWPLAPDRTDVVCEWYFHPEEMARPGFDPSPAIEFWDQTNRQDWAISEQAQLGIASRAYSPGPYSNREELLAALDRIVRERVERVLP